MRDVRSERARMRLARGTRRERTLTVAGWGVRALDSYRLPDGVFGESCGVLLLSVPFVRFASLSVRPRQLSHRREQA